MCSCRTPLLRPALKVNLCLYLLTHILQMCGGVDEEFHAFLTSTLHTGGCIASLCGRLNPLLRILGGPQNRYEGCGESKNLTSTRESNAIQHSSILKASCYTDRAITAFGFVS
jgi:hypothetical protein